MVSYTDKNLVKIEALSQRMQAIGDKKSREWKLLRK
jgi:hypothetical protein